MKMKIPEKIKNLPLWKKILSAAAVIGALGFVISVCCNIYGTAQKLDRALSFGNFSFTGLYDRITGRPEFRKETVTVSVQNAPGLKVTSPNPVEAVPGSTVTFTFEMSEDCKLDDILFADSVEGNVITVSNVKYPTTVAVISHKLQRTGVSVEVADFGDGYGELPGRVFCDVTETWSETGVELHAEANECFEFVCYTIGAPASKGGKVLAETPDAICETVPEDTSFYANFRRTHAVITVNQTDGLLIQTPPTLTAALGKKIFFVAGPKDGYQLEKIPEGYRYENGILYIDEVTRPLTLDFELKKLAAYALVLKTNDPSAGTATIDTTGVFAWENQFITAKAYPAEHRQFLGWSAMKPLESGGELLSTEIKYVFKPEKDLIIYANFGTIKYSVKIEDYPGLEILSENPMSVVAGTDAFFEYRLAEGFKFDTLPEGVTLYDGKIVLSNVLEDTVLSLHTYRYGYPTFEILCDSAAFGSVNSDHTNGKYEKGTQIALSVADGQKRFLGWSSGKPAASGGKIISTESHYTLSLSNDTVIYANFFDPATAVKAEDEKSTILYFPNGGTSSEALTDGYRSDTQSVSFYYCPNALPNKNYFTREGYILLGYSTNPDGSGDFYAPGWNITIPESRVLSLFCVWEKETPVSEFMYTVSGTNVTVTGYVGSSSRIVVPDTIEGKPVTGLAAGFLKDNKTVSTLIIGRNMKTISSGAISGCSALESLWAYDSVTVMTDDSVKNCPNFYNFNVMAPRYPAYTNQCYGTYTLPHHRLHSDPGCPRIVIVSGSNSAYGINSVELEEKLAAAGYRYDVTNFGQNASTSAAFYIETVAPLLGPGDFLIHEPEINQYQYGYNELSNNIWTIYEGSLEAFSVVDIRHYNKVFSTFAAFNSGKGKELSYDVVSWSNNSYGISEQNINRHGDLSRFKAQLNTDSNYTGWKPSLDKYDAAGGFGGNSWKSSVSYINNQKQIAELNRVYDLIAENGAKVLYSFPSIIRICLTKESQIAGGADQTSLMNAIDSVLHCTRISVPSTYILERNYSYNSIYHITSEGAVYRSDRLAEDLIAFLKKK
ncbi:MAG: hypothetical protein MJ137_04795 [Clostridia bacterium]|nr:hypothetical protein [Clostridia bacterium]